MKKAEKRGSCNDTAFAHAHAHIPVQHLQKFLPVLKLKTKTQKCTKTIQIKALQLYPAVVVVVVDIAATAAVVVLAAAVYLSIFFSNNFQRQQKLRQHS